MLFRPMLGLLLLVCHALLVTGAEEASSAKPVELTDWSTGWGSLDPDIKQRMQRIVQDAKDKEHQAQQELQKAKEQEKKADERVAAAEKARSVVPAAPAPAPASANAVSGDKVITFPIPETKEVKEAELQAREARVKAEAAEKQAEEHASRAAAAVQKASVADGFVRDEAEHSAEKEKEESNKFTDQATITFLQAQLADEKVGMMKLQALRGSQIQELNREPLKYMAFGGILVGLVAVLFQRFSRKNEDETVKSLKEPLMSVSPPSPYKEPEWTQDAAGEGVSEEDWRGRALEAQQCYKDAKLAADQLKVAAAEQRALADEIVAAAERRAAEAEVARATEVDQAEQARKEAEQAKMEAEQAKKEAEQAKNETEQAKKEVEEATMKVEEAMKEAKEAKENEPVFFTNVSETAMKEREAEIAELKERLQKLQKEGEEQLQSAKAEAESAKADLISEQSRLDRLEQELRDSNELNKVVAEVQLQRQQSEEQLISVKTECASLEDTLKNFKEEIKAKNKALEEATQAAQEATESSSKQAEELKTVKNELEEAMQAAEAAKEAAEGSHKRAEDAESSIAQYKEQLSQAKKAAVEASIALAAVRKQANEDSDAGKKALEEAKAVQEKSASQFADLRSEVQAEKSRADLADHLAKSRQAELAQTQLLAEKAKAALQTVRHELGSECTAAKAQVEIERKLAMESEELAEKWRLEAQAARSSEQEARVAEQEVKAAILKLQKGGAGISDVEVAASAEQWRKELSAAQAQTEEARASERRLQDNLKAAEAKDKETNQKLAEAKEELAKIRALYAEAAAARSESEQELVQANGQVKAAQEALGRLTQQAPATGDLSKAAGS
mmetsp:Transcript_66777/g.118182  ORF Transcript_66777/g.118182 Transcript_66777/m.118182 type:complete len:850 (+) Transcript_66777:42-2591(+)